jgi:dihydrofolate synthase/folylpolyglutamate synthase
MSKTIKSLDEWLAYLEQLHPKAIDLGLERVYRVALALNLLELPSAISHQYSGQLVGQSQVVTVAGTNGKGSCVATLECGLLQQQQRVASYTSPHLHHYCERIRIDGKPASESLVCQAFEAVDIARGDVSLSYFEFGTLAALWIFVQQQIPYVLLEVGLGGRLDAVNIVDADIAVITSIDLDHQDWLGNNRNVISREKLGVARTSRPLILAETRLTPSLELALNQYPVCLAGRDYHIDVLANGSWQFSLADHHDLLPQTSLPLPSVAAALCVLAHLKCYPPSELLPQLIASLVLPGRFQCVNWGGIRVIYDVAHNPAAAAALAARLQAEAVEGKTLAVMAVMTDKNYMEMLQVLQPMIAHWYVGDLANIARAASANQLAIALRTQDQPVSQTETIEAAMDLALAKAKSHDRIVVFGSFYTVAAVQCMQPSQQE